MDREFSTVRFVIEFIGDIWNEIFAMPDTEAAIEHWSKEPSLPMDMLGKLVALTTGLVRMASVPFVAVILFFSAMQWIWIAVSTFVWLMGSLGGFLSEGKFPLFPRYKE